MVAYACKVGIEEGRRGEIKNLQAELGRLESLKSRLCQISCSISGNKRIMRRKKDVSAMTANRRTPTTEP